MSLFFHTVFEDPTRPDKTRQEPRTEKPTKRFVCECKIVFKTSFQQVARCCDWVSLRVTGRLRKQRWDVHLIHLLLPGAGPDAVHDEPSRVRIHLRRGRGPSRVSSDLLHPAGSNWNLGPLGKIRTWFLQSSRNFNQTRDQDLGTFRQLLALNVCPLCIQPPWFPGPNSRSAVQRQGMSWNWCVGCENARPTSRKR